MGIIYETIIRSHTVKDTKALPIVPWTRNSGTSQEAYLAEAKRNCLETSNEIYVNAVCKRGLHIMNYPINHKVIILIKIKYLLKSAVFCSSKEFWPHWQNYKQKSWKNIMKLLSVLLVISCFQISWQLKFWIWELNLSRIAEYLT